MREEEKDNLFPQELVMRIQTERQIQPLNDQKDFFQEFRRQESHLLNKLIIAETFSKQVSEYDDWEFANFYPGGAGTENAAEIRGNWMPSNFHASTHGLQLRSLILRSRPTLTLKSIAAEIKLSFRLAGESTFWVITRGSGVRDPDAMVCKVKKEQDSQRVFLIFGANVGPNNEFKFFKKQEFPEINEPNEECLIQDYTEMKMTLVDNGDDRVFVSAVISNKRVVNMSCNKFIPSFREQHLFLAGSGDSVLVRNVAVRQIERVESAFRPSNHYECCDLL